MSAIRYIAVVLIGLSFSTAALARSLCPAGTEALCVPISDEICTYGARCVSRESVCFEKTTCNYEGFACKSDFNKAHEDAVFWQNQFNIMRKSDARVAGNELTALQKEYDNLSDACKMAIAGFADKQKSCANPYDAVIVQDQFDKLKDCIRTASTIEAARQCVSG